MTTAALSAAQFGSSDSAVEPLHAQETDEGSSIPLPYSAQTSNSARSAAVWRKPRRNLPLSSETSGSFFQPFGSPGE